MSVYLPGPGYGRPLMLASRQAAEDIARHLSAAGKRRYEVREFVPEKTHEIPAGTLSWTLAVGRMCKVVLTIPWGAPATRKKWVVINATDERVVKLES